MCDHCGCNLTGTHERMTHRQQEAPRRHRVLPVLAELLADNDRQAAHNRAHLDAHGVLAVNLMSAPGAGKTVLLEATLEALKGEFQIGVIEGDLETENDAARIRARGVPAYQITTGTACHLDAHMLHEALHHVKLDGLDLLFIENVGNLVCPVVFDLGETYRVAVVSAAEGHDKPAKYPALFRTAHVTVLNKVDLIPYLDFDEAQFTADVRRLNPQMPILRVSCRTGEGISEWVQWLQKTLQTGYLSPQTPRDR